MPRENSPAGVEAETFEVREPLLLIYIGRSIKSINRDDRMDIYEAVRYAWKINAARARERNLVLAYADGIVVGAYRPDEWLEGVNGNFPENVPGRWGFNGKPANDVWDYYVGKRVPDKYLPAKSPVRYCEPDNSAP